MSGAGQTNASSREGLRTSSAFVNCYCISAAVPESAYIAWWD